MKALRIFLLNCKISLLNEMAHKINFLMRFLSDSIYFVIYYIFYTVIFTLVPNINGWVIYDILLLMGTFHIIISLFAAVFIPNLAQIPMLVKSGGLDGFIVKPINSRFLLSARFIDIGSLINIILGVAIVINSIIRLGLDISTATFLLYIGYILIGVFIMYNILFILICTIFWLHDSSWSIGFFMTFNSFADKPISIYKGMIYRFLIYLFPIALVANIPASVMLKNFDSNLQIWFVIAALLLFYFSNIIWRKGITLYEGASI
ncbi:MAG: ABC-2 family transporter protein [Lachnospiraceae bacterium]|nr:ABC-2 family transporter protein [Lachnospiraceae bacterium]